MRQVSVKETVIEHSHFSLPFHVLVFRIRPVVLEGAGHMLSYSLLCANGMDRNMPSVFTGK